MKRLVLSLSILALALANTACEQHEVAGLPPHYQHKLGDHHHVPAPAPAEKK